MSEQRWNFVLDGMVGQSWLPAAERGAQTFPAAIPPQPRRSGIPDNDRGHIVSAVRGELNTYGITEQQVNQEGLQVTTTIDPRRRPGRRGGRATAARPAGEPALGARVGRPAHRRGARLLRRRGRAPASTTPRASASPGSSFKPFVLLAGLERTPSDRPRHDVRRLEPQTIAGTEVANNEGENCPNCDLRTAMTQSINTVFYQLGVQVGPQRVADAAHQAGVTAPLRSALRRHLAG